jgi:phage gp29-like protein
MSKILDMLFKRWKRPEKEPIAAPERFGVRSYASTGSQVAGAITPERMLSILSAADNGDMIAQAELFSEMERRDGELMGVIGQRRAGVLACKSQILPGDEQDPASVRARDEIERMMQDLDAIEDGDTWRDNQFDLTDAIAKAFSCLEVMWETSEKQWWPARLEFRPQEWWTVDETDHNKLLLRNSVSWLGEEVNPLNFIQHRHRGLSGCLTKTALARAITRPWVARNYALKDWLIVGELFGVPTRLGELPQGAGVTEKNQMLEALQTIGTDAYGVVPFGGKITFADVAKMSSADFFDRLMAAMYRWYQMALLGQTLTSGGEGGGAYALGTIHQNVRFDLIDSDAQRIDQRWSGFYARISRLNYGPAVKPPVHKTILGEPKDLAGLANVLQVLVGAGLQVPAKWTYDTFGIPAPERDETTGQTEAVLKPAAPAAMPGAGLALSVDGLGGLENAVAGAGAKKKSPGSGDASKLARVPRRPGLERSLGYLS